VLTVQADGRSVRAEALPAGAVLIRATLAALTALDSASLPNGSQAYVVAERETYQLDTANALTTYSPLIVARGAGAGAGKWYRRSRAYVVGNFTLWCQSYAFGVAGYTPGQLLASGNTEPDILLDLRPVPASSNQQQITIDMGGNIWFAPNAFDGPSITIRKYLLRDCLVSGTPTAAVQIPVAYPGLSEAGLVIFDRDNGLWCLTGSHGAGIWSAARLGLRAASSSNGLPGLTLTASPAQSTNGATDAVFDGQGNLWCSCSLTSVPTTNGGIIMFSAAQVAAGGAAVVPAVFWNGTNFGATGLGGTSGLAIAPNNWIWCSNYPGNSLRAWNMTGAATGNPAPVVTLTSATFNGPYSIAFDAAGNLWVSNGNVSRLSRIPAASLAVSGVVVPDVVITPALAGLTSNITFPNNPERSGGLPSGSTQLSL
jgi:sugar lactone lactonase YvrE